MNVIKTKDDIIQNIQLLEKYLCEGNEDEREFAINLIKRGRCFVAYKVNGEVRFSPSRFIGYIDNDMKKHNSNRNKDGKETNPVITQCLNKRLIENEELKKHHEKYCKNLGVKPDNVPKVTFWEISFSIDDFVGKISVEKSFPEGAIIERIHLSRERNSKVIEIAKQSFKQKHGKLFCEICGFDFQEKYGEIGEDYIEGHHIIAVSNMKPNHVTKPEEIAMVCANCHRVLHRKRPWLPIERLKELIIN